MGLKRQEKIRKYVVNQVSAVGQNKAGKADRRIKGVWGEEESFCIADEEGLTQWSDS